MNNRTMIAAGFVSVLFASATFSTDLTAIIAKVSDNCEKIESYAADASVRYKI